MAESTIITTLRRKRDELGTMLRSYDEGQLEAVRRDILPRFIGRDRMQNRALRGCLAIVFMAFTAIGYAQSNPPSPSPAEIQKPQQEKSSEAKPPAQGEKNRSQEAPTAIKYIPSTQTQNESGQNSKEADSKASTDWWIVWLTGILALIGFLQLIVFGLQARRLRQTIDTMKELGGKQSADMQASLAIAQEAASAATQSNQLTRDLFIAENRPWLILEINGWSPLIWEDKGARFSIDVTITNAGKSPATNVWFEAVAFPSGRANPLSVETVREYCVKRATDRDSVSDNGTIVVPSNPYRTGFNLLLFRDEIDNNIMMGGDWFSPAIKTCIAYRSAIYEGTKYTGGTYLGVDISEGIPKLLRKSKGDLSNSQFGVTHHPGCDIAT